MERKISSIGNIPSVSVHCPTFSAKETLLSGQCFRWNERGGRLCGTAFGRYIEVAQDGDCVTIFGATREDYEAIWRGYFDLDRDYDGIRRIVTQLEPRLCKAAEYAARIHILAQEPWEALCSFVISQNNNIPRIRGIIQKLCLYCGAPALGKEYAAVEGDARAFPTAEALAQVSEEQLRAFGCGYRANYLAAVSQSVAAGELDLTWLKTAPIDEARRALQALKGVGPKVAECVLLYGCGRLECFPIDVWIRRALETDFAGGTALTDSEFAGVAQQYIFEYIRRRG